MKTAIVYESTHHGNTKKLLDAITSEIEIDTFDITQNKNFDLTDYDCIGFASGIAYCKFYAEIMKVMKDKLPQNKKVFFLYTCGAMHKNMYTIAVKKIAQQKSCSILGEYGCLGFDTFGPFKLVGGVAKGHPTIEEINKAVEFYKNNIK